jgi:hypothetical protein
LIAVSTVIVILSQVSASATTVTLEKTAMFLRTVITTVFVIYLMEFASAKIAFQVRLVESKTFVAMLIAGFMVLVILQLACAILVLGMLKEQVILIIIVLMGYRRIIRGTVSINYQVLVRAWVTSLMKLLILNLSVDNRGISSGTSLM